MRTRIVLLLAALSAVSCAPSLKRIGYREVAPPNAGLDIQLVRNAAVPDSIKRLGTLLVYDNGLTISGSQDRVIDRVRLEGASLQARCINLYNIDPPSLWGGSCFQTYADFYADTLPRELALAATLPYGTRIDSTRNRGFSVALVLPYGWVKSGNQKQTGLDPAPDNVTKVALGLRGTYMFTELIGTEAEGDVFYTAAVKRGYKDFDLFVERLVRAGVDFRPLRGYTPFRLQQLSLRAGVNYDWLQLAHAYADLMTSASGGQFVPYGGFAGGFGWYAGAAAHFVFKSGFVGGIGLDYLRVNPKYRQTSVPVDGSALMLSFSFGYQFH